MARYDSNWLINGVKRIESIPISQTTFSDDDILELMTMELQGALTPMLLSVREEYFLDWTDYTLAAGENTIRIPSYATGLKLRAVHDITNGFALQLTRINLDETATFIGWTTTSYPPFGVGVTGYLMQADTIKLYPENASARTIRVYHYRQPSSLVSMLSVATVTAKVGTNTVQVSYVPTTFLTSGLYDLTDKSPVFRRKAASFSISNVGTLTFDVPLEVFELIQVGDTISQAEEACFPQYVPLPAHNLLIQGTGVRCLEALGDRAGYETALVKYESMKRDLLTTITPRDEASQKKVLKLDKFRNRVWR